MTEIPLKPIKKKKNLNTPETLKNYQNTLKPKKAIEIPQKPLKKMTKTTPKPKKNYR